MVTEAVWEGDMEPETVVDEPMVMDAGLTAQDMVEPIFLTLRDCTELVAP